MITTFGIIKWICNTQHDLYVFFFFVFKPVTPAEDTNLVTSSEDKIHYPRTIHMTDTGTQTRKVRVE